MRNEIKGEWRGSRKYIQHVGAVVRLVQKATLHDKAKDLLVGQALVRLLSQCGDFPEDDPEGPTGETKREQLGKGWAGSHDPSFPAFSSP